MSESSEGERGGMVQLAFRVPRDWGDQLHRDADELSRGLGRRVTVSDILRGLVEEHRRRTRQRRVKE